MSITKNKLNWDCVSNHMPDWVEDNESELWTIMNEGDKNYLDLLLDAYNKLTYEESKLDAFDNYGILDEKDSIIKLIIQLYEKYKDQLGKIYD